mgnify:FL=1
MTDKILKPLKVYSNDANDIALIDASTSAILETDPLLANVWLTNPDVFSTDISTMLGFFTNSNSRKYMMKPIVDRKSVV